MQNVYKNVFADATVPFQLPYISFSLIYLYSTFKNDRADQSAAQQSRIKSKAITQN